MPAIVNIGPRLASLRKEQGYSQEQLAQILSITGQAVSKWETGHALPDTALLPALARALDTSIDRLLTGTEPVMDFSPYDKEYEKQDYYWGLEHSSLAEQVVNLMPDSWHQDKCLLDIGSGEGRDAIFFARCGFKVDALEISLPGIEKIKQHSIASGCPVNTVHANMIGYEPSKNYAMIYSMGALQFLPPQLRAQHFERYKQHTSPGGLNAHMVFVEKPFIPLAPDWDKNEFFYRSGDLAGYYYNWEILLCGEAIIDCMSSSTPHQHAVSYIIARKVGYWSSPVPPTTGN